MTFLFSLVRVADLPASSPLLLEAPRTGTVDDGGCDADVDNDDADPRRRRLLLAAILALAIPHPYPSPPRTLPASLSVGGVGADPAES